MAFNKANILYEIMLVPPEKYPMVKEELQISTHWIKKKLGRTTGYTLCKYLIQNGPSICVCHVIIIPLHYNI